MLFAAGKLHLQGVSQASHVCHRNQPLHGHGWFGQKKVADDWRSVLDPLERIVDKAVLGIPPMAIIHQTIFNNLAFTISSCIIRIFFATAVSFGFNAILATLLGQKGSFGAIPMFWPCIYCTSNPSSWLVLPLVLDSFWFASHPHFWLTSPIGMLERWLVWHTQS